MDIQEIESFRIRSHLSKSEISMMLNKSYSYYGMVLAGSIRITKDAEVNLKKLCDFLKNSDSSHEGIVKRIYEVSGDMSFYAIALKTGISEAMFSKIKSKRRYPSIELIDKIASKFKCDKYYLRFGKSWKQ